MTKLRDPAIDFYDGLARGHWKAADDQAIQAALAQLTEEQRTLVRECVTRALDYGIHSFLFQLGVAYDNEGWIAVMVDGCNIVEQSDGLLGEPFGPDGWLAMYSKHLAASG
jgi:hypothetical protein